MQFPTARPYISRLRMLRAKMQPTPVMHTPCRASAALYSNHRAHGVMPVPVHVLRSMLELPIQHVRIFSSIHAAAAKVSVANVPRGKACTALLVTERFFCVAAQSTSPQGPPRWKVCGSTGGSPATRRSAAARSAPRCPATTPSVMLGAPRHLNPAVKRVQCGVSAPSTFAEPSHVRRRGLQRSNSHSQRRT